MSTKGDKTKQLICDKAYYLFARYGFHRVTMKDICEATGLSRGGLYGHYESTSQIFLELMQEMMIRQLSDFKMKSGRSAAELLTEILNLYKAEMLDGKNSLTLAIYEYYSQFPRDRENNLVSQYFLSKEKWTEFMNWGIEAGEFNPIDVDAIFDLLAFSYQGVRLYTAISEIDTSIPERIIHTIKKLVIKEDETL